MTQVDCARLGVHVITGHAPYDACICRQELWCDINGRLYAFGCSFQIIFHPLFHKLRPFAKFAKISRGRKVVRLQQLQWLSEGVNFLNIRCWPGGGEEWKV